MSIVLTTAYISSCLDSQLRQLYPDQMKKLLDLHQRGERGKVVLDGLQVPYNFKLINSYYELHNVPMLTIGPPGKPERYYITDRVSSMTRLVKLMDRIELKEDSLVWTTILT